MARQGIHEIVDAERWVAEFSLERLRAEAREFVLNRQRLLPSEYPNQAAIDRHIEGMLPDGQWITGPAHLAITEQLREEIIGSRQDVLGVETDLFVFGLGEPSHPASTKVGGLPFRPAARSWPAAKNGKPMTFVAQFCFAESRDLVSELPGDVLLIFLAEKDLCWAEPDLAHFEWVRLDEQQLLTPDQMPHTEWCYTPCFGAIHRTMDIVDPENLFEASSSPWLLESLQGTKIAGEPSWIQSPEDLPGEFLCTLGSIKPDCDKPYPFLNRAEPLSFQERYNQLSLPMWGDVGLIYIFLDENGQVHWTVQCG